MQETPVTDLWLKILEAVAHNGVAAVAANRVVLPRSKESDELPNSFETIGPTEAMNVTKTTIVNLLQGERRLSHTI